MLSGLDITHRRGGYRDPESQAFIESLVRYSKNAVSGATSSRPRAGQKGDRAYIEHYHHRPYSRLNYRTPSEVRQTWDNATGSLQNKRGPDLSTPVGGTPGRTTRPTFLQEVSE